MQAKRRVYTGLTLLEIVVSLGLVVVLTLFVVGVLSRILLTSGKTAHQTAANFLGEEIVDLVSSAGPPSWGFNDPDRDTWVGERDLILPGDKATTKFRYRLEELTLRNSPDDLGTFHELKVTVWWWGDEPSVRAGQGKTSVVTHRKLYVRR